MTEEIKQYFRCDPDTPYGRESSVHFSSTYRLDKAKDQASLPPVDIKEIIDFVNDLLKAVGIPPVESPRIDHPQKIDYQEIQKAHALADKDDIVWLKFTEDGYLGVVAASADINFDLPLDESEYHIQEKDGWLHNTPGILAHQLGKKWDASFVLLFPLANIPSGYKHGDIERAIGNYLIDKKVPILDFYSHNY